jgi:hypothetical protein
MFRPSTITIPVTFRILREHSEKLAELRTIHGLGPSVLMRTLLDAYFDGVIPAADERIAQEIARTNSAMAAKQVVENFTPVKENE